MRGASAAVLEEATLGAAASKHARAGTNGRDILEQAALAAAPSDRGWATIGYGP